MRARRVILVEGISDKAAVEAVAERRGRDLAAEGISVLAIGGSQAIGRVLGQLDDGIEAAGLCDLGEEADFRRALERAGLGRNLDRAGMESLGFFVCEADLEEELIRAIGSDRVEEIVEAHGDIGRFRTLQLQPEWRGRPKADQLRRFMGSGGRRKIRYAQYLVEALEPGEAPHPLAGLLAHFGERSGGR